LITEKVVTTEKVAEKVAVLFFPFFPSGLITEKVAVLFFRQD
jgi:hypothetical protein